jgi:hypothetical protein
MLFNPLVDLLIALDTLGINAASIRRVQNNRIIYAARVRNVGSREHFDTLGDRTPDLDRIHADIIPEIRRRFNAI